MSKRKHRFIVTDINALHAAFPQAIDKKVIPEHIELKPIYTIIAKLLDCSIPLPGIELLDDEPEEEPVADKQKPAINAPIPPKKHQGLQH